jgi:hypothetical protein
MSLIKFFVVVAGLYMVTGSTTATTLVHTSSKADTEQITLTGTVYSSDTNEPVIGAHIRIQNTDIMTVTDNEGLFTLRFESDSESILIRISHIGYRPTIESIQVSDLQSGVPIHPFLRDDEPDYCALSQGNELTFQSDGDR